MGVGVPGMCAVERGEMTAARTGGMAVLAEREEMTDHRDNVNQNSAELGDSLAKRVRL